ncbi:MAG: GNAT family N-acetyltransferase [Solobacterium sp.]|nr:GNAT family N-acetyltransferase [Solobacterium sp.]
MNNDIQKWILRDPARYAYLADFAAYGAEVLQSDDDALVLLQKDSGIAYGAGSGIQPCPCRLMMVDTEEERDRLLEEKQFTDFFPCRMAYAPEPVKAAPVPDGIALRAMTPADFAAIRYWYKSYVHVSDEEILHSIRDGMTGAYEGSELCGFAGWHEEGTIGFLYVREEYRHRGIALALETHLIEKTQAAGRLAYVHVAEGNEASFALQRACGMIIDEKPFYWMIR